MHRLIRTGFLAALLAVTAAAAAVADPAPDGHVRSPDGSREVWAPAGCHCVWGVERGSAPKKLFEIRGQVGQIAFSPDGSRIAFENPRGDWTVEAAKGSPAMQGFSPARYYGWGFIATFDFAEDRIRYVDPEFATDTDPRWESASTLSFTRHADGAKDTRLTRAVPVQAPASAIIPGSAAAYFATPLTYQPIASADGTRAAFVTREGAKRTIRLIDTKSVDRPFAAFEHDDGRALSDLALSPHGDAIAFVRGAAENKLGAIPNPTSRSGKPVREIWLGTPQQAPTKVAEGEAPQFTADGTRLMWEGERGLMIAPVFIYADGVRLGEASELMAGLVREPRFSPDGSKLVFGRGDGLFVYDLASDRTAPIDRPKGATDFAPTWSPDGTRLVFVRSNQPRYAAYSLGFDGPFTADKSWSIVLYDVGANATHDVWQARPGVGSAFYQLDEDATDTGRDGAQLYWTAGDRIVFPWEADGWRHLYAVPVAGGDAQLLTPGDGEVESVAQALDGTLVAATNIGDLGRRHLARIDAATATFTPLATGMTDQWGPAPMAQGHVAFLAAGWETPPQVFLLDQKGVQTVPEIKLGPSTFPHVWAEPKLITLTASDGATAYGQLFVPEHPNGCGVVFAHGGIKRQMLPGFHYMDAYSVLYETNQYLASKGCVVLSVEYRSSIMRGFAFRNAAGWGSAGASEMLDVAAAGTYLKTHPELKVRHVGIYGLSWGGYITAQALTRYPDIFEAGFDMAGVHEFFGDRTQNSPEAKIADLRAPIYLIQGDDDRNVDFYQGLSLAALLRAHGTDVTLRAVPDEVHDMTSTFTNLVDVYGSGADFLYDHLTAKTKRKP